MWKINLQDSRHAPNIHVRQVYEQIRTTKPRSLGGGGVSKIIFQNGHFDSRNDIIK